MRVRDRQLNQCQSMRQRRGQLGHDALVLSAGGPVFDTCQPIQYYCVRPTERIYKAYIVGLSIHTSKRTLNDWESVLTFEVAAILEFRENGKIVSL